MPTCKYRTLSSSNSCCPLIKLEQLIPLTCFTLMSTPSLRNFHKAPLAASALSSPCDSRWTCSDTNLEQWIGKSYLRISEQQTYWGAGVSFTIERLSALSGVQKHACKRLVVHSMENDHFSEYWRLHWIASYFLLRVYHHNYYQPHPIMDRASPQKDLFTLCP